MSDDMTPPRWAHLTRAEVIADLQSILTHHQALADRLRFTTTTLRKEIARLQNIENWAQKAGYYGEDDAYGERGASDTEDEDEVDSTDASAALDEMIASLDALEASVAAVANDPAALAQLDALGEQLVDASGAGTALDETAAALVASLQALTDAATIATGTLDEQDRRP